MTNNGVSATSIPTPTGTTTLATGGGGVGFVVRLTGVRLRNRIREQARRTSLDIDRQIQVIRKRIRQPRQMQMIEKPSIPTELTNGIKPGHLRLWCYVSHGDSPSFADLPATNSRRLSVDFHSFDDYVNTILFIFLARGGTNTTLFRVLFVFSNGPLLFANVMWRTSLVFHSLAHITTNYIHLLPAVITYVIRWYPSDIQRQSDLFQNLRSGVTGDALSLKDVLGMPMAFYLAWQALYLVKTEWLDSEKLRKDEAIGTSFRHLIVFYQNHFLGKLALAFGPRLATPMFVLMQLIYTAIVSLPTSILYSHQWVHLGFIVSITVISIWNGAGYYIFKLSKTPNSTHGTDASATPDSPEPTEVWFQRYIRRGNGGSSGLLRGTSPAVSRTRRAGSVSAATSGVVLAAAAASASTAATSSCATAVLTSLTATAENGVGGSSQSETTSHGTINDVDWDNVGEDEVEGLQQESLVNDARKKLQ
ncbi:hypothetical protein HK100_012146 [Physocladia obscura]|uniref:Glycerophosphocholine acyltransferase 1 n=1 Tax=Physocladia obscura TaxID=109957 RepID=A0AAD5T1X5_9FUNG|nr:hypothetical protein HK100_012146 [Physocladia obscura]